MSCLSFVVFKAQLMYLDACRCVQAHETHPVYNNLSGKLIVKKYNDPEDSSFKEEFEVAFAHVGGS